MKKAVVLVGIFCFLQGFCFAQELVQAHTLKISDVVVYKDENLFGLKDKQENVVVEAQYKKLIRVGESSFIIQKGARFYVRLVE